MKFNFELKTSFIFGAFVLALTTLGRFGFLIKFISRLQNMNLLFDLSIAGITFSVIGSLIVGFVFGFVLNFLIRKYGGGK